jgi:hypothetical protein
MKIGAAWRGPHGFCCGEPYATAKGSSAVSDEAIYAIDRYTLNLAKFWKDATEEFATC